MTQPITLVLPLPKHGNREAAEALCAGAKAFDKAFFTYLMSMQKFITACSQGSWLEADRLSQEIVSCVEVQTDLIAGAYKQVGRAMQDPDQRR